MHFARIVRAALVVATTLVAAGLGTSTGSADAAGATVACEVDYTITAQWQGGFGTNITMANLGRPLSGWVLEWSFTAGQRITAESWNGMFSQSGSTVRVHNASYNGTVATGASVTLGFNGTWSTANPAPKSFKLNGVLCTGSPTTTTTTTAPPPHVIAPTTTQPPAEITTTTTTVAPPPQTTTTTTTEPPAQTTAPDTFDWPTTKLKAVVALTAEDESLDTGTALVPLIIGLLMLTGGVILLLEIRRRVRRT
ncbi:hypothetical protein ALI22I_18050 [Saccharothrix sp. ALI-22-I]|uniref:cellulose-binding domain-containing protein n=1 Tax=Saccharothrix sp. ALI-22-I TaxID=1933778 RepID=UPI00097C41AD|nr:cellulose-binding domain-containing protein [Saccharothrix sp. ALI-22-I]ONI88865.1 hypothetical protein ALI22I_18050 [Saccharothrix sp. ALI-22-I]